MNVIIRRTTGVVLIILLIVALSGMMVEAAGAVVTSHKVKFNSSGASTKYTVKKIKRDKRFSIPKKPKKNGHTFKYWKLKRSSDGKYLASNGKWYSASDFKYQSAAYKKFYSGKKYRLSKKWVNRKNVAFTFFAVWEKARLGSTQNDPQADLRQEDSQEGTGQSGPQTYTIKYNANGGYNAPANQTKTEGTGLFLSSAIPKRSGYSFLGWATRNDSTTIQYESGALFGEDRNVILYAVWKKNPKSYTVKYNSNGGYGAPGNQIKSEGVDLFLSNVIPTREGYSFIGWKSIKSATTAQYESGAIFRENKNVTLYAVWKRNPRSYSIKYDANGGYGAPDDQIKTEGVDLKLSSVNPKRAGYSFLGWAKSSNATSVTQRPGDTFSENKNVTFYAIWKKNLINLSACTVYIDGQSSRVYDGTTFSPKIVVKDGSKVLTKNVEYTLSGASASQAGTHTASVSGIGDYIGKRTVTFKIEKATPTFTFNSSSCTRCEDVGWFRIGWKSYNSDGVRSFRSGNTSIATVDRTTGNVTPVNPGTTRIYADLTEGKNYKAGSWSYQVTITPAVPKAPTLNLGLNRSTLTIEWNKPAYARSFELQYKSSSSSSWITASSNYAGTKYTLNGLAPATTYSVRVRSVNQGKYSAYSSGSVKTADNYHLIYSYANYKNVTAYSSEGIGKATIQTVNDNEYVTVPSDYQWYALYRNDGKIYADGAKRDWYNLTEAKNKGYRPVTYYAGFRYKLDSSWTKNCGTVHPYYMFLKID